jgi:ADP-dependent NAD(P)H-hydrate dehydratase
MSCRAEGDCRVQAVACEAAACAVWLHGAAADHAARQKGEYGMLPQDIFSHLGQIFAENDR